VVPIAIRPVNSLIQLTRVDNLRDLSDRRNSDHHGVSGGNPFHLTDPRGGGGMVLYWKPNLRRNRVSRCSGPAITSKKMMGEGAINGDGGSSKVLGRHRNQNHQHHSDNRASVSKYSTTLVLNHANSPIYRFGTLPFVRVGILYPDPTSS